MKTLFVGASGDHYGADAVLLAIASRTLNQSGHSVVFALPAFGPGFEEATRRGLAPVLVRMPVLRRADLSLRGLAALLWRSLASLLTHARLLAVKRPDVVWVNTITIPLWVVLARVFGARVVCHSHEIIGGPRAVRLALYLPLLFAHEIIVVSDASRQDILETYPKLASRVRVAINPSFTVDRPIPVAAGAQDQLVVLGRLSGRKGQQVLIQALGCEPLVGRRLVVHVCGDTFDAEAARAFARDLQVEAARSDADVRFHGYVATRDALAMGGIVVVPSTDPDPCPLVVAEAIVAGRTIVASDCGGIAQLAGGAAALVPPSDPRKLAVTIAAVLDNPGLRSRLDSAVGVRATQLSANAYLKRMVATIEKQVGGVAT